MLKQGTQIEELTKGKEEEGKRLCTWMLDKYLQSFHDLRGCDCPLHRHLRLHHYQKLTSKVSLSGDGDVTETSLTLCPFTSMAWNMREVPVLALVLQTIDSCNRTFAIWKRQQAEEQRAKLFKLQHELEDDKEDGGGSEDDAGRDEPQRCGLPEF